MAFAQEVRDFTAAFKAVSDVLGTRSERELDQLEKRSLIDYRDAQRDKWRWDMGAEDRERADIISFASGGDEPWMTQPTFNPNSTAGRVSANGYNPAALEQAFADTESSGGDWNAVGPQTKYGRAYGKYQVLEPNVGPWTAKYYGQQLSPEEFLANKDAQQAVFHGEMGRMVGKYGNLEDAMSEWFTGVPLAQALEEGRADQNMGVGEYVQRVASAYKKYAGIHNVPDLSKNPPKPFDRPGEYTPTDTSGIMADGSAVPGIEFAPGFDTAADDEAGIFPSYWDTTQTGAARGVSPALMKVVTRASEIAGFPIGMNLTEVEGVQTAPGLRTPEQQAVFRQKGWSKTNNSKHLKGRAADLVPLVNGSPMDADQVTDEQWGAINEAMTKASAELGIPIEWGGNWTGFVDKPHYQLPDDYEEETSEIASTEPIASVGAGALPIDETAKDDALAAAGIVLPETAEAPPATEPISAPPPEAIPEDARAMGFDPLPQTTGYTDPVSRAGSRDVNIDAARRVAKGEGDNVPIKQILREVLNWAGEKLGVNNEAIDTGGDDPAADALMSGVGGAPLPLVQAVEQSIDPNNQMPDELRHIKAIQKIYNYYRLAGKPEKAVAAAFALYQTYKVMSHKALGMAQVFAEDGDVEKAVQTFVDAYGLVPDGQVLEATQNEDGTYTIETKNVETGEVTTSQVMTPRDIMSHIMGVTPDEFDALVLRPALGEQPTPPSSIGTALEGMPTLEDEAVPEGAAPDAEVAPEAPIGPLPLPGHTGAVSAPGTPMGVQIASLDETAGLPTDEAIPETPPGVPVAGTDGTTAEPAGAIPVGPDPATLVNPAPVKPVPEPVIQKYIDEILKSGKPDAVQAAEAVKARYDRNVAIWEKYIKNKPTATDVRATQAYNDFYAALAAVEDDQVFSDYEGFFKDIPNAAIVNSMRQAAEAHNAASKLLTDEAALNESAEALQALTEQYIPLETMETGEVGAVPVRETQVGAGMLLPGAFDYRTDITGAGAAPSAPVAFPTNDPRVLSLNKADRDTFEGRLKDANTAIAKTGEAWAPPTEVSLQDLTAMDDAFTTELDKIATDFANNADPVKRDQSLNALDYINKTGLSAELKSGAQALMEFREFNPGMNTSLATRTALAFMMPDMNDPTRSQFTAERQPPSANMPAGMIKVTSKYAPNQPILIPETVFVRLDEARQKIAAEHLRRVGQKGINAQRGETNANKWAPWNAGFVQPDPGVGVRHPENVEDTEGDVDLFDPAQTGMGGWLEPLPEDR